MNPQYQDREFRSNGGPAKCGQDNAGIYPLSWTTTRGVKRQLKRAGHDKACYLDQVSFTSRAKTKDPVIGISAPPVIVTGNDHLCDEGGTGDAAILRSLVDLSASLCKEQARSSPPSAAANLQVQLLSIFETYETAKTRLGATQSGNMKRLAETGAVSSGIRHIDVAGSSPLTLGTTIDTFIDTCQPLVVFVYGMGEHLSIGVRPGEVGPRVPFIDCSTFSGQAEAQRYFRAAEPGDRPYLGLAHDGRACR